MFDWMTWSVWALGFAIMIVWTIVPIREFRQMLKRRHEKNDNELTG